MFVPGVQQGVHLRVPRRAYESALALVAISAVLLAWAAFAVGPTSDGSVTAVPSPEMRSLAFIAPSGRLDQLLVQDASARGEARVVAEFPSTFTLHARGLASPMGDAIAVLWIDGSPVSAHLTVVSLPGGQRTEVAESFEYFSGLAWTPDGTRVAALGAGQRDRSGRFDARIHVVNAMTGTVESVVGFEQVFGAHPVGYSANGNTLLVVIVDESGSALWSIGGELRKLVGQLSAGQTRDWKLNLDGTKLAFTEIFRATGSEVARGRMLELRGGAISAIGNSGMQMSPIWRKDSAAPEFGGPGGTLRLADTFASVYLAPHAWAADGWLVATVYGSDDATGSLQLIGPSSRHVLADKAGASFLGFVSDIN